MYYNELKYALRTFWKALPLNFKRNPYLLDKNLCASYELHLLYLYPCVHFIVLDDHDKRNCNWLKVPLSRR